MGHCDVWCQMGQDSMLQHLYEGSTLYWSDLLCPVWRINVFPIYLWLGTISEESCSFMSYEFVACVAGQTWNGKYARVVCHGCKSKVYDHVRIIEYIVLVLSWEWNSETIMVLAAVEQSTFHDHVLLWSTHWSRCSHGQGTQGHSHCYLEQPTA